MSACPPRPRIGARRFCTQPGRAQASDEETAASKKELRNHRELSIPPSPTTYPHSARIRNKVRAEPKPEPLPPQKHYEPLGVGDTGDGEILSRPARCWLRPRLLTVVLMVTPQGSEAGSLCEPMSAIALTMAVTARLPILSVTQSVNAFRPLRLVCNIFLHAPVMLARGIGNIRLHNVSDYATNNIHRVTTRIGIGQMK